MNITLYSILLKHLYHINKDDKYLINRFSQLIINIILHY